MIKMFKALKTNSIHTITPIKKGEVVEINCYTTISGQLAGEISTKDKDIVLFKKNFILNSHFYENFIDLDKHRELIINKILEHENIS